MKNKFKLLLLIISLVSPSLQGTLKPIGSYSSSYSSSSSASASASHSSSYSGSISGQNINDIGELVKGGPYHGGTIGLGGVSGSYSSSASSSKSSSSSSSASGSFTLQGGAIPGSGCGGSGCGAQYSSSGSIPVSVGVISGGSGGNCGANGCGTTNNNNNKSEGEDNGEYDSSKVDEGQYNPGQDEGQYDEKKYASSQNNAVLSNEITGGKIAGCCKGPFPGPNGSIHDSKPASSVSGPTWTPEGQVTNKPIVPVTIGSVSNIPTSHPVVGPVCSYNPGGKPGQGCGQPSGTYKPISGGTFKPSYQPQQPIQTSTTYQPFTSNTFKPSYQQPVNPSIFPGPSGGIHVSKPTSTYQPQPQPQGPTVNPGVFPGPTGSIHVSKATPTYQPQPQGPTVNPSAFPGPTGSIHVSKPVVSSVPVSVNPINEEENRPITSVHFNVAQFPGPSGSIHTSKPANSVTGPIWGPDGDIINKPVTVGGNYGQSIFAAEAENKNANNGFTATTTYQQNPSSGNTYQQKPVNYQPQQPNQKPNVQINYQPQQPNQKPITQVNYQSQQPNVQNQQPNQKPNVQVNYQSQQPNVPNYQPQKPNVQTNYQSQQPVQIPVAVKPIIEVPVQKPVPIPDTHVEVPIAPPSHIPTPVQPVEPNELLRPVHPGSIPTICKYIPPGAVPGESCRGSSPGIVEGEPGPRPEVSGGVIEGKPGPVPGISGGIIEGTPGSRPQVPQSSGCSGQNSNCGSSQPNGDIHTNKPATSVGSAISGNNGFATGSVLIQKQQGGDYKPVEGSGNAVVHEDGTVTFSKNNAAGVNSGSSFGGGFSYGQGAGFSNSGSGFATDNKYVGGNSGNGGFSSSGPGFAIGSVKITDKPQGSYGSSSYSGGGFAGLNNKSQGSASGTSSGSYSGGGSFSSSGPGFAIGSVKITDKPQGSYGSSSYSGGLNNKSQGSVSGSSSGSYSGGGSFSSSGPGFAIGSVKITDKPQGSYGSSSYSGGLNNKSQGSVSGSSSGSYSGSGSFSSSGPGFATGSVLITKPDGSISHGTNNYGSGTSYGGAFGNSFGTSYSGAGTNHLDPAKQVSGLLNNLFGNVGGFGQSGSYSSSFSSASSSSGAYSGSASYF